MNKMKRRTFLEYTVKGIGMTTLSNLVGLQFLPKGLDHSNNEILIKIFLRGGCDFLNLIAPVDDRYYADAREKGLKLTDKHGLSLKNAYQGFDFRMHPLASGLLDIYKSNELAIIHASGLTNGTRSHFDAQDLIEKGVDKKANADVGWLNRLLETRTFEGRMPAVAASNKLPVSFLGSSNVPSIKRINQYKIEGDKNASEFLKNLYDGNSSLDTMAQETLETMAYFRSKRKEFHHLKDEMSGAIHAKGLKHSLKTVSQLIKMDVGLQVATVDYGGWDTHDHQKWQFEELVKGLNSALSTFYNGLNSYKDRITIVVMSEFGRRLKSNKSGGTDHGYGGATLVLGGKVKGGKMYGAWPGLQTESLDNRVDLNVTTDYRSILGEIIEQKMQVKDIQKVFPNFSLENKLGFV